MCRLTLADAVRLCCNTPPLRQLSRRERKNTDDQNILAAGSEALEWNRLGILAYQQKDYPQALALFRKATTAQPRNISFALNTAQSLLRLLDTQTSAALQEECRDCLQRARQMPAGDHRRERYIKLCERLEAL